MPQGDSYYPPPPAGTSYRPVRPLPPLAPRRPRYVPGTIGEGSIAVAGAQAAPLHPDEAVSHWRYGLATGFIGRWGGEALSSTKANSSVMLYFGAQADGLWSEGVGHAVRLRLRAMTGGEDALYVPSDGEVEAAYMLGRRELRFVIGRVEVGRYPALDLQTIAQVATLPSFEGSVALADDRMRFYYYLSPVEAAWAWYRGDAHISSQPGWPTETGSPSPASAVRLRYTAMVPPAVMLSVQGDFFRMWNHPDQMLSGEGSAGYSVLEQSVLLQAVVRVDQYTRRGLQPGTSTTASEVKLLALATLAL
jgi:hypothetical protein